MTQRMDALKSRIVCPICGQYYWLVDRASRIRRGNYVVCVNCEEDELVEVQRWVDGWDAAVAHAKGE